MKKFLSSILLVLMILGNITFPSISAVNTNGLSTPWTREKATHLAKSVLLYADSGTINQLVQAGSAEAAINLLFPDAIGPDRTAFNNFLTNYTASGFNWGNA